MVKQILVPLDGTAAAEQAIPLAGRLARAIGETLVLLRVVPPPVDYENEPYTLRSASAELDPGVQLALLAARHYLERAAASSDLVGVKTEVLAKLGPIAAMIVAVARTRDTDLIVMGRHDHTVVNRCILGSVAQTVARHAAMPVLTLPSSAAIGAPLAASRERPLRVLVPLDGSKLSEAALAPAAHLVATLAAPGQGAIHLLRVVKPETAAGKLHDLTTQDCLIHKAEADLDFIAGQLRKGLAAELRLAVTSSVAVDSDVAHAIIRAAERGQDAGKAGACGSCDLIALATHEQLSLQLLTLGSVSKRILASARLPVLIIRPEYTRVRERITNREEARLAEVHRLRTCTYNHGATSEKD